LISLYYLLRLISAPCAHDCPADVARWQTDFTANDCGILSVQNAKYDR